MYTLSFWYFFTVYFKLDYISNRTSKTCFVFKHLPIWAGTVYIRRLEDSLWELVLFLQVGLGNQTRLSDLVVCTFSLLNRCVDPVIGITAELLCDSGGRAITLR